MNPTNPYDTIQQLRQRVAELEKERDEEIARNRPLRNLIASLEEQKLHWNKQRDEYREAVSTMDSERSANAMLTAERNKVHQYWQIAEGRCDVLKQQRDELLAALENCRLLAARHRKEELATHILRFCVESGVIGSPIRDSDLASVKEKQNGI